MQFKTGFLFATLAAAATLGAASPIGTAGLGGAAKSAGKALREHLGSLGTWMRGHKKTTAGLVGTTAFLGYGALHQDQKSKDAMLTSSA